MDFEERRETSNTGVRKTAVAAVALLLLLLWLEDDRTRSFRRSFSSFSSSSSSNRSLFSVSTSSLSLLWCSTEASPADCILLLLVVVVEDWSCSVSCCCSDMSQWHRFSWFLVRSSDEVVFVWRKVVCRRWSEGRRERA